MIACHCGQCLRTHGHFSAYTSTGTDTLVMTEDRGLAWYRSSTRAERGFCRQCGASLFFRPVGGTDIAIAAGSLEPGHGLRLKAHIFVADKPDYYEINDDLPKYEADLDSPRMD